MFNCMVMNKFVMSSTAFEACTVDYASENELNLKPYTILKPAFGFLKQPQRPKLGIVGKMLKKARKA